MTPQQQQDLARIENKRRTQVRPTVRDVDFLLLCIKQLEAENAALRAAQEWQPIEGEARRGQSVNVGAWHGGQFKTAIAFFQSDGFEGYWFYPCWIQCEDNDHTGEGCYILDFEPTHYAPLPAAPAQATAGE